MIKRNVRTAVGARARVRKSVAQRSRCAASSGDGPSFSRRFFYQPVSHFLDGQARYTYPTLPMIEAALWDLRQPPWGAILEAKVFTGDYNYTKHIVVPGGWDVISNLEARELRGNRETGPALLDEFALHQHLFGVGSVFMLDAMSKLAGAGGLDDRVFHAIAAATREGVVYEISFQQDKIPQVVEATTGTPVALCVPPVFPGYNRDESDRRAGPDALGFPWAVGTDGAMG